MKKVRSLFTPTPMSVQEVVAHWQEQLATNPLWDETDRAGITQAIRATQGKTKKQACAALRELSQAPMGDPQSRTASCARFFLLDLRYGRERKDEHGKDGQ